MKVSQVERGSTDARQLIPHSPIARALAVLGDRWTMLVLRDVFLGKARFSEFADSTAASRATLNKRLRALVDNEVLYRAPYQERPPRVEYRLTDKGFALYEFALALWQFETRWADGAAHALPPKLRHRACGRRFLPIATCTRCDEAIRIRDINYRATAGNAPGKGFLNFGSLRRSSVGLADAQGGRGPLLHAIDLFADPWTPLVLAAAFMGIKSYDEIRRELGIATNILANRLKLLVEGGVLEQKPGHSEGKRLRYYLSEKGRELIVVALALHNWSLRWLPASDGPRMEIRHNCSRGALRMEMRCSHCRQALRAQDVEIL